MNSYTREEAEALHTAMDAANGILDKLWTGQGPRYYVTFIELGCQERVKDPFRGDRLVTNHAHSLIMEGRERL